MGNMPPWEKPGWKGTMMSEEAEEACNCPSREQITPYGTPILQKNVPHTETGGVNKHRIHPIRHFRMKTKFEKNGKSCLYGN